MLDPLDTRTLEPARRAAGLSRAALAARANVSETTIMRIEKGSVDPRIDGTWAPVCRALAAAQLAHCPTCDARAEHPSVRSCTCVDCPMRAAVAA